jgi:hypothetical protein
MIKLMACDWADGLVEDRRKPWQNQNSSFSIPHPLPLGSWAESLA